MSLHRLDRQIKMTHFRGRQIFDTFLFPYEWYASCVLEFESVFEGVYLAMVHSALEVFCILLEVAMERVHLEVHHYHQCLAK